ncbi:hypothetical protein CSAL01_06732 [Colletotrichum salicis]|uniref:Uncharacterized protein n=1 Tax=Colletotrichum salicis TaxID=1209931 RepID=A0A135V0W6_9PEZI|nr:hypothetical protein CSAL01_06732 [Colletotrichum salicis]
MPTDDAVVAKPATQIHRKPHRVASASSVTAPSSTSPPPASPTTIAAASKQEDSDQQKDEEKAQPPPSQPPLIQANPWGFFLEDDLPSRNSDSPSPSKEDASPEVQKLSVQPLRIVKTGSTEESTGQGIRPSSSTAEDVTPKPLQITAAVPARRDSPDTAQLAPAPLKLARPQSPAAQQRPSRTPSPAITAAPAPEAPQLPYPAEGSSIPTPDSHPQHQSTAQPGAPTTLPFGIRPAGSPPPVSPSFAPSRLSPAPPGTSAPQQQQPQNHPQPTHTQAAPVSPAFVQAALPPTLPVSSYFPQQPSYAKKETTSPNLSAHHSPVASTSRPSTSQGIPQASQHSPAQPYASPPPSYTQAMSQMHLSNTSPSPTQTQWLPPPPPPQGLSPTPTGVPLPLSSPPTQYPWSPNSVGPQSAPLQQQFTGYNMPPPIPQPTYVNGTQNFQPQPTQTPPPLPPRHSPPMPGTPHSGFGALTPFGGPPPPTRPNYQAPPPKSESRLFSSATARKLLTKTTELVDQTITPYLQDNKYYRPPYNWYQNQNPQNQNQNPQNPQNLNQNYHNQNQNQNNQYPPRPQTATGYPAQQQQQQYYSQQQSYAPSQRV